jgi:V/A-type H+/Na+-transporting ATPase subunit D
MLRAVLLGGQDALRLATRSDYVDVEVTWTASLGFSYPVDVRRTDHQALGASQRSDVSASTPRLGNAAMGSALDAYRTALLAGVRTAAAEEAVRRVEAAVTATRRQLRAMDKRWLPWLREARGALELSLEQAELEDGMRLRRALSAQPHPRQD